MKAKTQMVVREREREREQYFSKELYNIVRQSDTHTHKKDLQTN